MLSSPVIDIARLNDQLGQAWGVSRGESPAQYLAWSAKAGLFALMAARGRITLDEVCAHTELNSVGADALLCILASLQLIVRDSNEGYTLAAVAREYLLEHSPYYVGAGLYLGCEKDIPAAYLTRPPNSAPVVVETKTWDTAMRLRIQHSRNFAPSVVAARCGEFDSVRHLVDVAGGSGVFAIPLALDHPSIRITLVEIPDTLDAIRQILDSYNVAAAIDLVGMNVYADEWRFTDCDAVFFGNFFHASTDEECAVLARRSYETLLPGGRIALHEVLLNETRDGPVLAALWNANMVVRKKGARQRTASELTAFLTEAGFAGIRNVPTAGCFSLLVGTKPK